MIRADVLGENNRMLRVFARSGAVVKSATEAGVVHLSFPTEETEEARAASEARERRAAAESVPTLTLPAAPDIRPRRSSVLRRSSRTRVSSRRWRRLRPPSPNSSFRPPCRPIPATIGH